MDRPQRPANPTTEPGAAAPARDFTLRRGAHIYRLRADAGSERDLLRHIRLIARPEPKTDRRAA